MCRYLIDSPILQPTTCLQCVGEKCLLFICLQLEVLYVDPYSNPKYDIQANKIRAKADRDAARARAAREKAEKYVGWAHH